MITLTGSITFEKDSIEFSHGLGLNSLTGSATGYSYDPYAVEIGANLILTDGTDSIEVIVREVEAIRSGNLYEIRIRFSDRVDEMARLPVVYDEFDNINGKDWNEILAAVQKDIPYGWSIRSESTS
ncbi:MAG: hypothetical protein M1542_07560 [Thermotogae bacterium]|jgi:hypothetical protein|nr:hypothetical protein [Thermotogota bacterium]MCL5033081.1 hypothetical protein [Thermotogota bacterium]